MKDKPTILIVDDQPQNIELLEAYLVPEGYEIVKAANGEEALGKLSGNQIDLILLDVLMPDMDGFEVTRRVRQDNAHRLLPIILVTVLRETEDRVKGIEAGCDDFISMPVDKMELLARVRSLLKVKDYNDLMSNYRKELESEVTRRTKELKHAFLFQQRLIDALPVPVFYNDSEGRYLGCNSSFEKFIGQKREQVIGKSVYELSPKEFADIYHEKDRALLQNPGTQIHESVVKDAGGVVHNVIFHKATFPNMDGSVGGLTGAILDITDRKRAEEELSKSEERFRKIFDKASDGILIADAINKNFLQGNAAICSMLGYTKEEIKDLTIYDIHPQKDISHVLDEFEKQAKGEIVLAEGLPVLRKDGSIFYADIGSSPATIAGINYLVGIFRDITERKRAEEALRESENKYRLLADNANDVIFVLDMNMNYTYVSPSVKILRGYEPAEVLKQSPIETVTPSSWDLAVRTLSEVMELEKFEQEEIPISRTLPLEMKRKDGTTVWTEVNLSFIRDEDQRPVGILGVTRDITKRRQAEEELLRTLENLRKAVGTTIQVMVSAVESRDPYTAGHQLRVADLARAIAMEMGLPQEKIDGIRMAGSIHDLGKLSIPAEILSKPTKLTNNEFSLIKEHPQKGYEILKDVESPWPLAQIVYQHHERMDGSGYPRNLKGDEILMEARIMAVADVVEAMASHRPYRPALGIEVALEEIENNKGIFYDNAVADACLRLFRKKGFQLEKPRF